MVAAISSRTQQVVFLTINSRSDEKLGILFEMNTNIETTSFPLTRQQHVADASNTLLNSV